MNPVFLPKRPVPCSPLSTRQLLVQREDPGRAADRAVRPRPLPSVVGAAAAFATYATPVFRRRLASARSHLPPLVRHTPMGVILTCLAVGLILGKSFLSGVSR
jgi:hypothetical protein